MNFTDDKTTGEKIIRTQFYNENDEKINPLDIQNKMCNAEVALKVESLFIGNKISLQVKLYEANVKLIETGMKRLLSTSTAPRRVLNTTAVSEKKTLVEEDEGEDEGRRQSRGPRTRLLTAIWTITPQVRPLQADHESGRVFTLVARLSPKVATRELRLPRGDRP